jgi:hypothetical protein
VLRLIPSEYHRLSSLSRPAWRHPEILGLVSLLPRLQPPGPPLRELAVRLCGSKVAEASWVVFLYFPECQMPCSEDTAIVTRTRSGWRLWYSKYRRP